MGLLADSSVVIDVFNPVSPWFHWSLEMVVREGRTGPVGLNQIILAEVLAGARAPQQAVILGRFVRFELPWSASAVAGAAHGAYKRRGGEKDVLLPDFLIGAHAAVENLALITRDPRRIRTAFPGVRLITPETDPL